MKSIRVILAPPAKFTYQYFIKSNKKQDRALIKAINKKTEIIKTNYHLGNPIAKKLIPKEYLKIDITNLFRLELPFYWRILYTLKHDDTGTIALILEILDHKNYNKRFNYRAA